MGVSMRLQTPKWAQPKPSPEQENLGPAWNHVVRGCRLVQTQATPNPTPISSDTIRLTERLTAPTSGQCKPAYPQVSFVESTPSRSNKTDSPLSSPRASHCLRRSLISWRNHLLRPAGHTPSTFHGLIPPNIGSSPASCTRNRHPLHIWIWQWALDKRGKALRLACWDVDGVRGRKLELEQFLTVHDIPICLLNETHVQSDRAVSFGKYIFHRTDRPTRGGGTAILVRSGIEHCCASLGSAALLSTATQLMLAARPVKLVAV
jgi:hypothetical protein